MRKLLGRTTAILAGVAAPLALAIPAHAADFGEPLVVDGVWKAYGQFNDGPNEVCVRAYNSVGGAYALTEIFLAGTNTRIGVAQDFGGDDQKSCSSVSAAWENASVDFRITHVGTGGNATRRAFNNRVL